MQGKVIHKVMWRTECKTGKYKKQRNQNWQIHLSLFASESH